MFGQKTIWPDYIRAVHSKRARRLSLRLQHREGRIVLTIPKGISDQTARRFVDHHESWIETQLNALPSPIYLQDGALISLFGSIVRIAVHFDPARKTTKMTLKDTVLEVITNKKEVGGRIVRFLKKEAQSRFAAIVKEKASKLGRKVGRISIRDTASRWGSCSVEGDISLSWRLVFAPEAAMDYVIAHEVAHLEHMDHSPSFWACCESLCLDYKGGKSWMKNQGLDLMRYAAAG